MPNLRRPLCLMAVVAILASACTSNQPTPTPSGGTPSLGTPVATLPGTPGAGTPIPGTTSSPPPTDPSVTPGPTLAPTPEPTPAGTPPPVVPAELGLERVLDGLDCSDEANGEPCGPVGIFAAGDERLFVLEQTGLVHVAKPRGDRYEVTGTFLDIRRRVACCGERGILGMAFHPNYRENGLFYVTYSDNTHSFVLDERHVSVDPDVAEERGRRNLISIYKRHDYHWGGGIAFGRDGYLWLGMGDGGFVLDDQIGDPDNDAQDLRSLFGKLLRIDVSDPDGDGPATYGIPADNPYVGTDDAQPEIWARGLRNPWRWSFDALTGDLWLTDTGHNSWEEVNRLRAPDLGRGENFGWRLMEGPDCYIPASRCDPNGDTRAPLTAYRHAAGQCAITGGQVYRGQRFPALASRFIFGDYCSGRLWSVDSGGRNQQRAKLMLDTDHIISAMGSDWQGEIYMAEYAEGAIYRIMGESGR